MADDSIAARVRRLRAEIAWHKRTIREHKEQLHAAAAELAQIEAECRRLGISLVVVSPTGVEGDLHGHTRSTA